MAGPGAAAGGYAAPVVGNAAGDSDPNEVGNDGLTSVQRQVFAVLKRPEHFANSAGITVEQARLIACLWLCHRLAGLTANLHTFKAIFCMLLHCYA